MSFLITEIILHGSRFTFYMHTYLGSYVIYILYFHTRPILYFLQASGTYVQILNQSKTTLYHKKILVLSILVGLYPKYCRCHTT